MAAFMHDIESDNCQVQTQQDTQRYRQPGSRCKEDEHDIQCHGKAYLENAFEIEFGIAGFIKALLGKIVINFFLQCFEKRISRIFRIVIYFAHLTGQRRSLLFCSRFA